MNATHIIVVHLRQPRRSEPNEGRTDPFYEFGSFGCTGCHSRNLLNPRRAHELNGARFAFAQGGKLGFRLIHLTPPARVVEHRDVCELTWKPAEKPFRYDTAPLLVNSAGESDFPGLLRMIRGVDRFTWPQRFSSKFRTTRTPLPPGIGQEVARVFDRLRARAKPSALAATYLDTLPYMPNNPDLNRRRTFQALRGEVGPPCKTRSCAPAGEASVKGERRSGCRPCAQKHPSRRGKGVC